MTKLKQKITPLMLAKDVLKWLTPETKIKIKPLTQNNYIKIKNLDSEKQIDLQEYLKSGKSCEVCAVGSLIAARAFREDKIKMTRCGDFCIDTNIYLVECGNIFNKLRGIFSYSQLRYIESAFESGVGVPSKYKSAKNRLKWIMKNIVENKGKFVPKFVPNPNF